VNAILEEITRLAQIENADVVDKLRLAKKFERKCVAETRKIKGPVRASRLLKAFASILRHLKLAVDDGSGNIEIMASLGLILTHLIDIASKTKECQSDPHHCANKVYNFIKNVLNADPEWIFNTLLCSEICGTPQTNNSYIHWLLRLVLSDPVLMSYDISVVNKAMAITQLVLRTETPEEKNKLKIADFWLREPEFRKRSEHIDIPNIIKAAKKRTKIKGLKSGRHSEDGQVLDSSNGVQWVLSTTPSALPLDFQLSDVDDADEIHEDVGRTKWDPSKISESPEHSNEEVTNVSDDSDIEQPSSKRSRFSDEEVEEDIEESELP